MYSFYKPCGIHLFYFAFLFLISSLLLCCLFSAKHSLNCGQLNERGYNKFLVTKNMFALCVCVCPDVCWQQLSWFSSAWSWSLRHCWAQDQSNLQSGSSTLHIERWEHSRAECLWCGFSDLSVFRSEESWWGKGPQEALCPSFLLKSDVYIHPVSNQ